MNKILELMARVAEGSGVDVDLQIAYDADAEAWDACLVGVDGEGRHPLYHGPELVPLTGTGSTPKYALEALEDVCGT